MLSFYDSKDPNIIKFGQNKTSPAQFKKLLLAREPRVTQIPNGRYAGIIATEIRLSYSPLLTYPYDLPSSICDKMDLIYSIEDLVKFVENRQPKLVWLRGGEALFKWDDIKYLIRELENKQYSVIVDTCGIINPFQVTADVFPHAEAPTSIRLIPQLNNDVVKEGEYFHYYKQLVNETSRMINDIYTFSLVDMELIFEVPSFSSTKEEEIWFAKAIQYLDDVNIKEGNILIPEKIIFVPREDCKLVYNSFYEMVGKYLINMDRRITSIEYNYERLRHGV